MNWETVIAGPKEPGERLVISGTVYKPDSTTSAPNVILYLYHTNAQGVYPTRGDETGNALRHGYLRSWLKTDSLGRYRFSTIRPAPYPGRKEAAHIHAVVLEPGKDEYWIESYKFADDPLLSKVEREGDRTYVLSLTRNADSTWIGRRDIILMND